MGCHIADSIVSAIIAGEMQEILFQSLCCGFKWQDD